MSTNCTWTRADADAAVSAFFKVLVQNPHTHTHSQQSRCHPCVAFNLIRNTHSTNECSWPPGSNPCGTPNTARRTYTGLWLCFDRNVNKRAVCLVCKKLADQTNESAIKWCTSTYNNSNVCAHLMHRWLRSDPNGLPARSVCISSGIRSICICLLATSHASAEIVWTSI